LDAASIEMRIASSGRLYIDNPPDPTPPEASEKLLWRRRRVILSGPTWRDSFPAGSFALATTHSVTPPHLTCSLLHRPSIGCQRSPAAGKSKAIPSTCQKSHSLPRYPIPAGARSLSGHHRRRRVSAAGDGLW
jgi:hypothetical protein